MSESRRRNALPSSTYILGFILVAVVAFAGVSWWMLDRMDAVSHAAQASNLRAADRELRQAVHTVIARSEKYARQLATWEETRQQLADPTYYLYWRENRAYKGSALPDYVSGLEVYDHSGQSLLHTADATLPAAVPEQRTFLRREGNGNFLYYFVVVDDGGHDLGWVGLKVDFQKALQELSRLRYADPASLNLNLHLGERLNPAAIPSRLHYTLLPAADTGPLERVMTETLVHFLLLAMLLGAVYYLLMSLLLGRPLRLLAFHIDALRRGTNSPLSEQSNGVMRLSELEKLRQSLNSYQQELDETHASLDRKNDELWKLAHHDPLTGAFNRRAYDDDWEHLLSLVRGRRNGVSIMLFDCDHFKAINDTYGHDVGDEVIRAVASCLASALREGDRFYRLGGDEFAVQLLDTSPEEAQRIAKRCLRAVTDHPFHSLGIREPVNFSVGLSYAEGTDEAALLSLHRCADVAMYQAKRPGSGKVVRYRPDMDQSAGALVSSRELNAVHQAIENGAGLVPHFQPVKSLVSGCEDFFEVLIRIEDQEGLISPAQIFPIVEAHRLESDLDQAVIARITHMLADGTIPAGTGLSINLAGPSLLDDGLLATLSLLRPHLTHHRIILEITETALITELWEASERLSRLREQGFVIALDDFGSGYSSLRYLSSMPVDIVKFDIDMVHDLERRDRQRLIVENVAAMILNAGYRLVAEGVENAAQLERVRQLGFTHVQGFHIDRPLNAQQAFPPPARPLSAQASAS